MSRILVEHDGPVTTLVINRPEVRNALDREASLRLAEAIRAFEDDPGAMAAVLTGAGGHFCAGGLGVALWCDLRIAERSASFAVLSRRWGVPTSDGTTVRLPRLIGMGRALDMPLASRAVRGEEAERIGLASRLVEDGASRAAAEALAREIAAFPEIATRPGSGRSPGTVVRTAASARPSTRRGRSCRSGRCPARRTAPIRPAARRARRARTAARGRT